MSLDNNNYEHLFEKTFEVNLHKFYLMDPNNMSKSVFSGFGYIRYFEGKEFFFKFYVHRSNKKPSGIFSIDEDTADEKSNNHFKGVDRFGTIWKFKTTGFGVGTPGIKQGLPVIYGHFDELIKTEKLPEKFGDDFIEFIFSKKYKFPFNKSEKIEVNKDNEVIESRHESSLSCDLKNLRIEGSKSDKFIHLIFKPSRKIYNLKVRLLESLKFITGRQLNPGAIVTKKGSQLITEFYPDYSFNYFQVEPPLRYRDFPSEEHLEPWYLFGQFLNFISRYRSKYFTPLGAEINGIIGAGPAFFETKLLNLSVRIEGILKLLYPKLGIPKKNSLEDISNIENYLEIYDSNDTIKKRVLATINMMKQARAKDKLLELKKLGVINKIQYDSWSKLRNKSAHAVKDNKKDWLNKDLKRYYQVIELLYRIIFYAIKYDGEYTSYGDDKKSRKKFKLYSKRDNM